MADQKISELTNITGANLADADEFVVVDVSADQTKAVTRAEFFKDTPPITVTGAVTAGDMFITGPTPILTLTDDEVADEYTRIQNASGNTLVDTRNGASDGQFIVRGLGGGVTTEHFRANANGVGIFNSSPTVPLDVTGSAKISGNLTVDTSTLHVDSPNNRVGVGTTSPTERLDVANGVARFSNNITPAVENDGAAYFGKIGNIAAVSGSAGVAFRQNGAELGRINSTGLGIGTTSPSAALDVVGTTELNGNTTVNDGWLRVQGSSGALYLEDTDVSAQSRIWQTGENLYIDNQSILGGDTYFRTDNGKIRQIIRDNGDISFRNTAGTVEGLHWDAATESLGIGTTSPDVALHVNSGAVNNVAKFHSTDLTASIYLTDGSTTGGDAGVQGLLTTGDNLEVRGLNSVILATGTTDRLTIDSSGHAIIPAGVTLGTAAGVYSAANTLDDYEEGTWTPTVTASTAGTITTTTSGNYTKIGNTVYLTGTVDWAASTAWAVNDYVAIGGVPFNSAEGGTVTGFASRTWPTSSAQFIGQVFTSEYRMICVNADVARYQDSIRFSLTVTV